MMKNSLKKITLVIAAVFTAACAFADVKVSSVTGKCEYENNGIWQAVEVGQVLSEGTKIQTGFKSELILKLVSKNEDSTITVAQLSRMTIEQLISSDTIDKTKISLDTGAARSEINRTGNVKVNFTLKTPVATASVRGTIVTSKNVVKGTKVITDRGNVEVCETSRFEAEEVMADENAPENMEKEVQMPKGSYSVGKSQSVEMKSSGENKGTKETANDRAKDTGSMKTAAESETKSFAPVNPGPAPEAINRTGAISVNVEWED